MPSPSRQPYACVAFIGRALLSGLMICCLTDLACSQSGSGYDVTRRRLDLIEPGTVVEKEAPKGWTHLIAKSRPRLGAGDVDKVPARVVASSNTVFTALLAKVERERGEGRYRLARLAAGVGVKVDGKDTIVTPETRKKWGVNLPLLGRMALDRSYDKLQEAVWVARSDTMAVFDAPGQMVLEGRHRAVVIRSAVLLDDKTGRLEPLVWMIELDDSGAYKGASGNIEWERVGEQSDTILHVDANEFVLGVPTEMSFATMGLLKGKKQFPITEDMKPLLGRERLSKEMSAELEGKLRQALRGAEAP
jgi:hypothetical protein